MLVNDGTIHDDWPAARLRPLTIAGVAAAAGAIAASLTLFLIAKHAFDVSLVMPYRGPGTIPLPLPAGLVAVASAVPAFAAAGLLGLLMRVVARPWFTFALVASVLALLSLSGPLSLAEVSADTRLTLILMHLSAAAVIVGVLFRLTSHESKGDQHERL